MRRSRVIFPLIAAVALGAFCLEAQEKSAPRQGVLTRWMVDGVEREGLVFSPAQPGPDGAPLVFGFHGHGGGALQASRSFRLHEVWPEACVVYLQGLPTPGQLTDPEGKKSGWQGSAGILGDRDLKFFDTALKAIQETQKIDSKRIYATGHSNGGGFTYLLWAERPDVFAAMAPSAAVGAKSVAKLTPKPALHLAGTNDPLVKYAWQERMIDAVKTINGCSGDSVAWAEGCTQFSSEKKAPLVVFLHEGGHKYPTEGPALIVRFFKEHAKAAE